MTDIVVSQSPDAIVTPDPDMPALVFADAVVVSVPAQGPVGPPGSNGRDGVDGSNGAMGPPGPSGDIAASVAAGETILAGQAVYVKAADGKMYRAHNDAYVASEVVGLAVSDVSTGFVCAAVIAQITLPDWTAVVGASSLTVGATYYLATSPGQLSTVSPTAAGLTSLHVGVASGAQTLAIRIGVRVLL